MYQNYYNPYLNPDFQNMQSKKSDDRILGGFLGPFILGGITGGLVAPAFYPNRPYYNNYYYPYPNNYYYYGGYYR